MGGMYLNFFAAQISADKNYGSHCPRDNLNVEKNDYDHRPTYLHKYIKDNSGTDWFPEITDSYLNLLRKAAEKNNVVLHTHYFPPPDVSHEVGIPGIRKVRLHVYTDRMLIYLLFLAKVCTRSIVIDSASYRSLTVSNPEFKDTFFKNIALGQTVSQLSLFAKFHNLSVEKYVINMYGIYQMLLSQKDPSWEYLDPHKLLFGSDSEVNDSLLEWQHVFDMAEPFDMSKIIEYKDKNFEVIKETFGMSYQDLCKNWRDPLIEFAKKYDTPIEFNN